MHVHPYVPRQWTLVSYPERHYKAKQTFNYMPVFQLNIIYCVCQNKFRFAMKHVPLYTLELTVIYVA